MATKEKNDEWGDRWYEKLYDWSASVDPLIPKDYQEGLDWWNPHAVAPHGSYQNVVTQGDPLKNTPITPLHKFGKRSSTAFGVWLDEERIKKEKEEREKNKRRTYMESGGLTQQVQNVSNAGRYGDTMLMHVNPKEVQGIASVMPMTINPETGQPEMFIGALLGSLLGSTFLPGLAGGTMLGAAGAGAIGSALGTWAETGDIEKGIMSGIMGYGFGSALGEIGSGATAAGETAAQEVLTESGTQLANTASAEALASDAAARMSKSTMADYLGNTVYDTGEVIAGQYNPMERLGDIGSNLFSKNTLSALSDNYLPIAIGGGQLGAMEAQEQFERDMEEWRAGKTKRQQELFEKYPEQVSYRSPYYMGKEGGQVPQFQDGGEVPATPTFPSAFDPYAPTGIPSLADPAVPATVPVIPMGSALERVNQWSQLTGLPTTSQLQSPFAQTGVPLGTINPLITETPTVDASGNPTGFTYTSERNPVTVGPEKQLRPSADYIPGMDAEFNYFPGRVRTAGSIAKYGDDYSTYYDPNTMYNPTQIHSGLYGQVYGPNGELLIASYPYDYEPGMTSVDPNTGVGRDIADQRDQTTGIIQSPDATSTGSSSSAEVLAIQEQFARNLAQTAGVNYDDYVSWSTENPLGTQGVDAHFTQFLESVPPPAPEFWEGEYESYDEAVASGKYELDASGNITFDASGAPVLKDVPPPATEWFEDAGYGSVAEAVASGLWDAQGNPIAPPASEWFEDAGHESLADAVASGLYEVVNGEIQFDAQGNPIPYTEPVLLASDLIIAETGLLGTTGSEIYANWQKVKNDPIYADPYAGGNYPDGEDEDTGYWFMIDPQFQAGGTFTNGIRDINAIGNPANAIRLTEAQWANQEYPSGFGSTISAQPVVPVEPEDEIDVEDIEESIQREFDREEEQIGRGRIELQGGGSTDIETGIQETVEQTPSGEDIVVLEAKMAILGQHQSPDQAIQDFIEKYGIDAFLQFRDMLLQQQVPNAQTEGIISGQGGGMDDMVNGMIGNQQGIAVSPGEYIVPADVVSMLGDGSSDSGADRLDEMLEKIRINKTGTSVQAEEINEREVLPI